MTRDLTARELEVLALLATGLTNEQIGARMNLSGGAINNCLLRLYPVIGVRNRVLAAIWWDRRERGT